MIFTFELEVSNNINLKRKGKACVDNKKVHLPPFLLCFKQILKAACRPPCRITVSVGNKLEKEPH